MNSSGRKIVWAFHSDPLYGDYMTLDEAIDAKRDYVPADPVWAWDHDWYKGKWLSKDEARRLELYQDHTGMVDRRFSGILFMVRNCHKDSCAHINHPEWLMTKIRPSAEVNRW